jgi:Putative transposase
MTLDAAEFIRRFLLHVLPTGFHRIRHYGLFAPKVPPESSRAGANSEAETPSPARRCPCCGGRMIIVETFEGARPARSPPPSRIRIDTS